MSQESAQGPRAWTEHIGRVVGFGLLVVLALLQFADLRRGPVLHGAIWSRHILLFLPLAALGLPFLAMRGRLTAIARGLVLGFLVLLAWSLWSAMHSSLPRIYRPKVWLGRSYMVMPVIGAAATLLAAWGIVAAIPVARREMWRWRAAMVIAFTTPFAWARTGLARHLVRLGTGMGGAAVYHVVLLLALGVLLAGAAVGIHRRWSLAGSVLCAVGVLLTASRAGLACLLLFAVMTLPLLDLRRRLRPVALGAVGLAASVAVVAVVMPGGQRLFDADDPARTMNLHSAWDSYLRVGQLVTGLGSGRVWPWYAFETGKASAPGRGIISTVFGPVTTNPHSVPLGVLVELGVVGIVILVAVLATLAVHVMRPYVTSLRRADGLPEQERLVRHLPALAVVASLVAFIFDYYLLKNFSIAFYWWLSVAFVVGAAPSTVRRSPKEVS